MTAGKRIVAVATATVALLGVGLADAVAGTVVARCSPGVPVSASTYFVCAGLSGSGSKFEAYAGVVERNPFTGNRQEFVIVNEHGATVFTAHSDGWSQSAEDIHAVRGPDGRYLDIGRESESGSCYSRSGVIVPVRPAGAPQPYSEGFC